MSGKQSTMSEGGIYATEDGKLVGLACRHPYHPSGRTLYIERADGELRSVLGVRMRKATARERLAFYEERASCDE